MFNAKWGFTCGGAAFALAFAVSLILGHTSLLVALVRGGGFAVLFFGLGTAIWALINIFVPELLSTRNDTAGDVFSKESAGSRVNITVDDEPDAALPADMPGALPGAGLGAADTDEVGDFNDLISRSANPERDIDQNTATGYTQKEAREEFTPAFDNPLSNSLDSSLDSVKIDGLGDFSMDFGAFVSNDSGGGGTTDSDLFMDSFSLPPGAGDSGNLEETPAPPPRKSSRNKPAELQGDFNPKEIAAGLRTVLEKDKKG